MLRRACSCAAGLSSTAAAAARPAARRTSSTCGLARRARSTPCAPCHGSTMPPWAVTHRGSQFAVSAGTVRAAAARPQARQLLHRARSQPPRTTRTAARSSATLGGGICIEGNPAYLPALRAVRSCTVIQAVVANDDVMVQFADAGVAGGIVTGGGGGDDGGNRRRRAVSRGRSRASSRGGGARRHGLLLAGRGGRQGRHVHVPVQCDADARPDRRSRAPRSLQRCASATACAESASPVRMATNYGRTIECWPRAHGSALLSRAGRRRSSVACCPTTCLAQRYRA